MQLLNNKKCIFCQSNDIELKSAALAPFISAKIGSDSNETFNLIHCKHCGCAFFDYRYDENEVSKIYTGYRNEQYQKLRQKYESWYSKEINNLIGDDIRAIESRNKNLSEILKNNIDIGNIRNVLDFGGDRGQYIPNILNNAKKYVYDISCKGVLPEIKLIKTIEECENNMPCGYDFIICAHVLEHLSYPEETIKMIKSLMKNNGYLYIELPFDSPFYKNPLDNVQYLFNKYFKLKDILKKYIEMKTTKHFLMHEHINYYTQKGLDCLMKRNGFVPICNKICSVYSVIGISKVICALYSL